MLKLEQSICKGRQGRRWEDLGVCFISEKYRLVLFIQMDSSVLWPLICLISMFYPQISVHSSVLPFVV